MLKKELLQGVFSFVGFKPHVTHRMHLYANGRQRTMTISRKICDPQGTLKLVSHRK